MAQSSRSAPSPRQRTWRGSWGRHCISSAGSTRRHWIWEDMVVTPRCSPRARPRPSSRGCGSVRRFDQSPGPGHPEDGRRRSKNLGEFGQRLGAYREYVRTNERQAWAYAESRDRKSRTDSGGESAMNAVTERPITSTRSARTAGVAASFTGIRPAARCWATSPERAAAIRCRLGSFRGWCAAPPLVLVNCSESHRA